MATAVIIAGQARSFERVWRNQYWMVYRKVPDPYFFVSVADDADASKMDLLKDRFPGKVFIEKVIQPTIPEPKGSFDHGAYPPSAPVQGILRQMWALNQGWKFFDKMSSPDGLRFDRFLRIRPDLHFHKFEWPKDCYPSQCLTPWWSRWGGINDRVAVLGALAAEFYFTAFEKVSAMLKDGAPLHPESLMLEALEREHVVCSPTLNAFFTTVRKDGSTIPPDPTIGDIVDFTR